MRTLTPPRKASQGHAGYPQSPPKTPQDHTLSGYLQSPPETPGDHPKIVVAPKELLKRVPDEYGAHAGASHPASCSTEQAWTIPEDAYYKVAGYLDEEGLRFSDATCTMFKTVNNNYWKSLGTNAFHALQLDEDGQDRLFNEPAGWDQPEGAESGRKPISVNWRKRFYRFLASMKNIKEAKKSDDAYRLKDLCCSLRKDHLTEHHEQGIYIEAIIGPVASENDAPPSTNVRSRESAVEPEARPESASDSASDPEIFQSANEEDNEEEDDTDEDDEDEEEEDSSGESDGDDEPIGVTIFDKDVGGSKVHVTFFPELGMLARQRQSDPNQHFCYILPLPKCPYGFSGKVGLYIQGGQIALFRKLEGPKMKKPWETTGFISDLGWATGRTLRVRLSSRDGIAVTNIGPTPPIQPLKRMDMFFDADHWTVLNSNI